MAAAYEEIQSEILEERVAWSRWRADMDLTDELLEALEQRNLKAANLREHIEGVRGGGRAREIKPCPNCSRGSKGKRCEWARQLAKGIPTSAGERDRINGLAVEYGVLPVNLGSNPEPAMELVFRVQREILLQLRQQRNRRYAEELKAVLRGWDGKAEDLLFHARVNGGAEIPVEVFARVLADRERGLEQE